MFWKKTTISRFSRHPSGALLPLVACLLGSVAVFCPAKDGKDGVIVFPSGRRVYYEIEAVPILIPAEGGEVSVTFSTVDGRSRTVAAPVIGDFADLTVNPMALSPGLWRIEAGACTGAVEIASSVRNSPFSFVVRGDALLRSGGPVDRLLDPLCANLAQIPADDWAPPPPEVVDRLTRAGVRFTTLGTVARSHYIVDESRSWADPEVLKSAMYSVCHQAGTWQYLGPGFIGIHLAEFPRLTCGVLRADGEKTPLTPGREPPAGAYVGPLAVPAQEQAFRGLGNGAAPDPLKPEKDFDAWMTYQRWRTSLLGNALGILSLEARRGAPALIGCADFDGWDALAAALYPPLAAAQMDFIGVADAPSRSSLGLLGAAAAVDVFRAGAWGKPLLVEPFQPGNRWPAVPPGAFDMSLYSALARKVEGVCWPQEGNLRKAAERAAARIAPISGMLYETRKLRDKVGLFYSRDQHLYAISRETAERQPGLDYPGRIAAAWLTASACGYPVTLVTEEDIIAGAADDHKVLIVTGLTCTREPVQSALDGFARDGRTVLADTASGKPIEGARQLPFAFPDIFSQWRPYKAADPDRQGDRDVSERFVRPNVEALAKELEAAVAPFAKCDNPSFMLSEQGAGLGRYVWVVNTAQEKAEKCQWRPVAASGRITLPKAVPVVYDVFGGKNIEEREFDLELGPGDAALFGLFQEAINIVGIDSARFSAPMLNYVVSINSRARVIRAVFPVEIELIDPNDRSVMTFRRGTRNGKIAESVPLGNSPAEGTWRIIAKDTITGRSTIARFEVRGSGEAFATSGPVTILEPELIRRILRGNDRPLILTGDKLTRMAAAPLAAVLKEQGAEADIGSSREYLKPIEHDPGLPYLGGMPPLAIDRHVVLPGSRRNNPLIRKLVDDYRLAPPPLTASGRKAKRRLAPGRSMVFRVGGAFGINRDIVVVYADDPKGLERGVKALADVLRGRPAPETMVLDAQ